VWLPSERRSPREARELVRAVCEDWGIDETISDDAFVVVTELVTNAVVRARTPCVVRVAPAGAGLRIDVEDDCPCPMPIPGRGPVDLAGPVRSGPGKLVWAVLVTDPASSS
jgi:hypothetical protein